MSVNFAFNCPRCLVGHCNHAHVPYIRVVDERVISAPNMPAFICDVCGYTEFDIVALQQLDLLLDLDENMSEQHPAAHEAIETELPSSTP